MSYRTALITGASSGIGLALARLAALDGIEVVLASRRTEVLDDEARGIREQGGSARVCTLDVSKPEATQERLQKLDDELGGIDLVVANAGLGRERWSGKLDWREHCAELLAVNVVGFTATVTALTHRMVERKRGHIVGISSLASYRGLPRSAVYCGSKAFVSTFLESLRVDLKGTGVRVTDVRPGFVRTPLIAAVTKPMPMLMDADDAARTIWRGVRQGHAVVEFPWVLARALRASRLMPTAVYDAAIKKVT
jgi:short-subunit dehydrogenase